MITMLLGGLWHGAGWTFVIWGAYHGLLLSLYRRFGTYWDQLPAAVRQVGMFVLVVIGWVFFRATDFTMAASLLGQMFSPTPGILGGDLLFMLPPLLFAAWWAMLGPNVYELRHELGWRRRVALTAQFAASLALIAGSRASPFLYFQF
jgi:alginate O-acetyltransferase complex protein AlgI